MTIDIQALLALTKKAGEAIMEVYSRSDFENVVSFKDDNSPLTLADKASHKVIMEGLKEMYPEIPIISEEGKEVEYDVRREYETFWMVDPLDGTKEFINKNGEFTVNIALVEGNSVTAGFIYAPALDVYYYGVKESGAYKIENSRTVKITVNNSDANRVAVRSKSHASPEEEEVLAKYNVKDSISVGSSLKFCMVAEGKADVYYRHGPTMEWDTAAGQAILEAADGVVYKETSTEKFTYNKKSLLNGSFLCLGF